MKTKELLALILIATMFAISSNMDFNDYELAHGAVQVAQK